MKILYTAIIVLVVSCAPEKAFPVEPDPSAKNTVIKHECEMEFSMRDTTWMGLKVVLENRCSPYEPDDYRHSQKLELAIIDSLGGIWSPYTNECFDDRTQTDIEHIIAKSEAHDSGLCAATPDTRAKFAEDPLNLTLANPRINRHVKGAKDAAEWHPFIRKNRCWFVYRVIAVRQKYGLTIDPNEAMALEGMLGKCTGEERNLETPPGCGREY